MTIGEYPVATAQGVVTTCLKIEGNAITLGEADKCTLLTKLPMGVPKLCGKIGP